MFFDTHAHIDDKRFDKDRDELIRQVHEDGVDLIMNVGADMDSSAFAIRLSEEYDFIYAAVGVHPHDADGMTEQKLLTLRDWAAKEKVRAIGEIGLDYYYDNSERKLQRYWFERQIELAREVGLPIIVHNRDAHADCLEILKRKKVDECGGVMHCYSGSVEMAKEILKLGMYISIAGPVTFNNATRLANVVRMVPIERLLIETDCPYLTPVPHRGKRNHPGYVKYVAQKVADIKSMTIEEVAAITKQNAINLFGI